LAAFAALGVPHPPLQVVGDESEPSRIGYPVAAKVLSADILHKSEAGGVALDVGDDAALRAAVRRLTAAARRARPDAEISGVLLSRMQKGLAEALLGYKRDPEVGPAVILGAGGVLAEAFGDFAVRIAPVAIEEARRMIEEVRGLAGIRGFRSLPKGDAEALARAVVAVSELARIDSPRVLEAEINPLVVKAEGVVAVDALVVLDD
jgi:succinyl-CoA synthetase beta subunit